jgi:hypothetical protein
LHELKLASSSGTERRTSSSGRTQAANAEKFYKAIQNKTFIKSKFELLLKKYFDIWIILIFWMKKGVNDQPVLF